MSCREDCYPEYYEKTGLKKEPIVETNPPLRISSQYQDLKRMAPSGLKEPPDGYKMSPEEKERERLPNPWSNR